MKRAIFERPGTPGEVLRIQDDVPAPQPGRGEVLVRMLASPINPSDLMFIAGRYGILPRLPATPGFEGVGVVEATGGGFLGWLRNGKRVAVIGDCTGTWTEYTVTKARQVIPVPDDISDEQAATFFTSTRHALVMTRDDSACRGKWLLQSAAGGELGKMVIRLGKKYGFRTLNVVRRREQVEELKGLGADAVIVESDGPLPEQVAKVAPEGVKYALDPVGGKVADQVIQSLAPGGRCLLYGSLSDDPVSLHPRLAICNTLRVECFWLGPFVRQQRALTMLKLFRRVRSLMPEGFLQSTFSATAPKN